jgi:quaternary ammonium compound-resistance protein SugE
LEINDKLETKMSINWIILIVGGVFESIFAMSLGKMQHTSGKEMWIWLFVFLISVSMSMYLLFKSMGGPHPISTGTAYAVWAGIGAVGTVILGILVFKEPITFWRMFFLSTLIISIMGLQLTSTHS